MNKYVLNNLVSVLLNRMHWSKLKKSNFVLEVLSWRFRSESFFLEVLSLRFHPWGFVQFRKLFGLHMLKMHWKWHKMTYKMTPEIVPLYRFYFEGLFLILQHVHVSIVTIGKLSHYQSHIYSVVFLHWFFLMLYKTWVFILYIYILNLSLPRFMHSQKKKNIFIFSMRREEVEKGRLMSMTWLQWLSIMDLGMYFSRTVIFGNFFPTFLFSH